MKMEGEKTMARERKSNKGNKKEYKTQNFRMKGELVKFDTFGKDDEHVWLVIAEETNETKYTVKMFNVSDEVYNKLADAKEVLVNFNLSYSKNGNNIALQIVANSIEVIE